MSSNILASHLNASVKDSFYEVVPGGCSAGLFRRVSGEGQVSGLDAGAGCSAKTLSVWADMLGGVGDSE